jgi:histidinol-phosphate/aromatic aminotransferase/cobyric acid decarboxylase-like protein
MSAASYAIKSPNIHVVRSMAKDFGLNGFKIGIVISSNPIVMQKFSSWRKIISHHPFTISVINEMLLASNYGQNILKHSKVLLK